MIRALRVAATIGLWALAALGLVGATVWVLAQFGVAQPLVVVSESMRPALRAGDLVLAVRVPVDALVPGDVVSVARDEESRFITHRLLHATPVAQDDGWELVLKGDANPVADPKSYAVGRHTLKVVWTAPFRVPLGTIGAAAEAAWSDVVHAVLDVTSPIAGPPPYAITTTTAWNALHGTSNALCHDGATIEYDWAPSGSWVALDGGGDQSWLDAVFTWDQQVTLATSARCWQDGRVSDWVPATNNGVSHGIRRPYVSGWSGYTNAPARRFEAHFQCPPGTTSALTRIGVRRNGSAPSTVLWSTAGTSLVAHWSGTMGNGSVWMAVACTGPWGVANTDATHHFGPGCVPTITVAICTNYYRG